MTPSMISLENLAETLDDDLAEEHLSSEYSSSSDSADGYQSYIYYTVVYSL